MRVGLERKKVLELCERKRDESGSREGGKCWEKERGGESGARERGRGKRVRRETRWRVG